jgi:hypothetical protein
MRPWKPVFQTFQPLQLFCGEVRVPLGTPWKGGLHGLSDKHSTRAQICEAHGLPWSELRRTRIARVATCLPQLSRGSLAVDATCRQRKPALAYLLHRRMLHAGDGTQVLWKTTRDQRTKLHNRVRRVRMMAPGGTYRRIAGG